MPSSAKSEKLKQAGLSRQSRPQLALRQDSKHAAGFHISVSRLSQKCHRAMNSVFGLGSRAELQVSRDSVMLGFRGLLFSATATAALLTNVNARAETPVAITYVANSLAEASIANGPWTLHSGLGRNRHDD
jgi:hypothetical protein